MELTKLREQMTPEMRHQVAGQMGYSKELIDKVLLGTRNNDRVVEACEILIGLTESMKAQFEVMVSSESLVS